MKKVIIGLIVVLLFGGLYLNYGKQASDLAPSLKSAALLEPGSYQVSFDQITLTDTTRKTNSNGDYEGADDRTLKADIYSPRSKPTNPQPLMIYSHGFMSSSKGGKYLAEYLASHGYTVAAATYPLTNLWAPGGPNPEDVVNQPGDISFIIDHLLERSASEDSQYFEKIDASRIVVAGLSLGGLTSKLVTYHPTLADQRIAAAISVAGPSYLFAKKFFETRSVPFMMIASPDDAIVAFKENAADILQRVTGGVLVQVDGGSHAGFADTAKWFRWFDNADSLACRQLMDNPNVSAEVSWADKIGSAEIGVIDGPMPGLCTRNPLPKTMNPLRQHQLNTLAVAGFLNCHFAETIEARNTACDYLSNVLPAEFTEISVHK